MKNDQVTGVFRECSNPECRFRYPDLRIEFELDYCPKCGEPAAIQSKVVNAFHETRNQKKAGNLNMVVLLDNLRSVYNVGSIFRTCEGLGIQEIYLTGISPTPEHPRLAKTGLGAEGKISWKYQNNALDLAIELRHRGFQLIGLECTQDAVPIQKFDLQMKDKPFCLIAGNERLGIDPEVQNLCDALICIPMSGIKESLNVSVAFAIASFYLTELLKSD